MAASYADQAAALAAANQVTLSLAAQPLAFLQMVWAALPADALVGIAVQDCYPDKAGGYVESVQPGWCWNADVQRGEIGRLLAWAEGRNRAHYPIPGLGGVFWHIAARKPDILGLSKRKRGDLSELTYTGVLACDLDCAAHGYTLEQGMDVLLKLPLPPSLIVFSGGGLQAIHLLSEPWPLPHAAAALEYKAYSLALYRPTFEAAGLQLDTSVHEASRMLRLPGYINRKPERGGTLARIVYAPHD